jgi:oxygen-independent coproporphyrinogen-3 oxidase
LARAQSAGRLRRNFQGYTTDDCETLIGLGASAIGRMREGYVQNAVKLGDYSTCIAAGRPATAKGCRLTDEDRLRAAVIERLMFDFEADIPAICARHGFDPACLIDGNERLSRLVEQGLVDVAGGIVRVRGDYRFLVRAAAAAFDAYLERSPRVHGRAA